MIHVVHLAIETDRRERVMCNITGRFVHEESEPPRDYAKLEGRDIVLRGKEERLHPFTRHKTQSVTSILVKETGQSFPVRGHLSSWR